MSRLYKAITLGLLVGILGLGMSLVPYGKDLEENIGLELLFKLRGSKAAPSEAVVIAIDKSPLKILSCRAIPGNGPALIMPA